MGKALSMGMDIGSVSAKGVILEGEGRILASEYLWTQGDPVEAARRVIRSLESQLPGAEISSVGVTGSARKLVGFMLEADTVKNEITAHAVGALHRAPRVQTILEIGGQDSKIILIRQGVVADYAMNSLCAAGTGAFLTSQAGRLGLTAQELGDIALRSRHPARIAARCTVFAESDLVHKAQMGHSREDLVAGLCHAVVSNYLNNVGKGKRIEGPVVFQGGVSKNKGVVQAFREQLGMEILVEEEGHLMGALGVALLSGKSGRHTPFDYRVADMEFSTETRDCAGCPNHCEIVSFYRDGILLGSWGNRCEKGA